jgi:hypothetical protein
MLFAGHSQTARKLHTASADVQSELQSEVQGEVKFISKLLLDKATDALAFYTVCFLSARQQAC